MVKNFYTVQEFVNVIGAGLVASTVYMQIKQGRLPHKKIGTKILIPAGYVEEFLLPDYKTNVS